MSSLMEIQVVLSASSTIRTVYLYSRPNLSVALNVKQNVREIVFALLRPLQLATWYVAIEMFDHSPDSDKQDHLTVNHFNFILIADN